MDMKTNNTVANIFALIFLVLGFHSQAETYTYTGPNYHTANPPYTTSMAITGSFTTSSAIPPNAVDFDLRPIVTSWSFSDGVNTQTNANSGLWDIGGLFPPIASTDANGDITSIIFLLFNPATPHTVGITFDQFQIRSDLPGATAANDLICTGLTDNWCGTFTWDTVQNPDFPYASADLGTWQTGPSAPPAPPATSQPVPAMSLYTIVLTAIGLSLLAGARLRKSVFRKSKY
jgi:hypothetical protein